MKWKKLAIGTGIVGGFALAVISFVGAPRREGPLDRYIPNQVRLNQRSQADDPDGVKIQASLTRWQQLDDEVQTFDQVVRDVCQAADLQIATPADWQSQCRRISLALLGSGVSLRDMMTLEQLPEADRVPVFIESCLDDLRWSNYWSERFTRAYVGDSNGPFIVYRRRKFRIWLAEQFAADKPYNQLVSQLITADGLWTDHPEVNFFTATADGEEEGRADPIRLAGRTSRVFLGQRIDCLQCHDDFLDRTYFPDQDAGERPGTQIDFHQLAAFFGGASVKNPFLGLRDDGREYKATLLGNSDPAAIEPKVPFDRDRFADDLPPRQALAKWLTAKDNKQFARATVNRVWTLMVGRPLVDPVDHITPDAPLYPALDELSNQFIEHNYSIKELIRMIAASQTFQRGSRSDLFTPTADHEKNFAVFPISRLRPEQIVMSIVQASTLDRLADNSNILAALGRNDLLNEFLRDFGDQGDAELTGLSPTVTQRLLLLNGRAIQDATKPDLMANAISKIATFSKGDVNRVELLYKAILNRVPSDSEVAAINESISSAADVSTDATEDETRLRASSDLSYALFNSAEFQWNH